MGKGTLEVLLVDAKGLASTDFLAGKIDPYVLIQYRSQERKSSIKREAGKNPVWNETFKFSINTSDLQHKLVLKLMDHDTFSRDDYIGEATINMTDLVAIGMEKGYLEQHPAKYSVVLADKSYCGEIRVGLSFRASKD
ncbi:Calcium-dependent lipid-binding (CaLB domain) family protein [Rhynchospora pubera]|uniref:Calcium-dependent lipid-binding (CaLB domain) family protein n=1 Tax=Rhynchospora pubera TaxID=906938 RepID=A0AAV8C6U3_9POAL|nr:Calcium-dependent lipid-binding (CaLB domain) family protein [Rhynchospora pubera]KAJ4766978.1 Calcium-dependent lipid-binding (CaLB domain) family protein [Rhynchospora pubera]KAJ4819690.1 Calcium-dependent lipid-binding (CaLB domain) family protein [Rhynchospora pubera]